MARLGMHLNAHLQLLLPSGRLFVGLHSVPLSGQLLGEFRCLAALVPPALPITRARHRPYHHHQHRHHTFIRTNRSFSMISLIIALNRSHSWALPAKLSFTSAYTLSCPHLANYKLLIALSQLKVRAIRERGTSSLCALFMLWTLGALTTQR